MIEVMIERLPACLTYEHYLSLMITLYTHIYVTLQLLLPPDMSMVIMDTDMIV